MPKWFLLQLGTLFVLVASYDYSGYKLLRFEANEKIAEWLEELEGEGFDMGGGQRRVLVDVWAEPSKHRTAADVLVAPEFHSELLTLLRKEGVRHVETLNEDIQRVLQREKRKMAMVARRKRSPRTAEDFDHENYHSYDEMVDYMQQLAKEKPGLVTLLNIARTSENRSLYGVLISKKVGSTPGKPAIFVDAGIHAREWIAPAAALHMIHRLVYDYEKRRPEITRTLDKFDWYIVPQSNPDGYEYSRETDRLWRKTRSRNTTINRWCVGADANRNWGYKWGEAGANRQPCSNIYAGSQPFSEPEIAGIRDYVTWQIPQLIVYASLHSYGQLLLSPWGYTNEKTDNHIDQRNAARAAVVAMKNATGVNYTYGTISELMYPASGTSIDYMQHKGIPYIFGVELRPTDSIDSHAFSLPPSYIKPTGEEMLAGLIAVGDYAVVHQRL